MQLLNVVYIRDDVMGRGDFWVKTKGLNVFVCCFSTGNSQIKLIPFKEAGSLLQLSVSVHGVTTLLAVGTRSHCTFLLSKAIVFI